MKTIHKESISEKKGKFKKLITLFTFFVGLMLLLSINVKVKAETNLQIMSLNLTNKSLIAGQKQGFTVTSNTNQKVQYKTYLLKPGTTKWEVIQDWTSSVDGDLPYTINPEYIYGSGSYRVSVRVKSAGTNGIYSDIYGSYDNYKAAFFQCNSVQINSIDLTNDNLITGQKQGFTLVSNTEQQVQYKALILKPGSTKWEVIQDWTSAVDGNSPYTITPDFIYNAGLYRVSIWVKAAGTNGIYSTAYGSYDNYKALWFQSGPVQIKSLTLTDNSLAIGETQGFNLTSNTDQQVQYKALILKPGSTKWEVIQDWTSAVNGSSPYTITPGFIYGTGSYRVSVWVKIAGTNGISSNTYGTFDSYKAEWFYSSPLGIESINITDKNLVQGEKQGFDITSNSNTKVQYKIFLLKPGSAKWEAIQDWTEPVNGNEPYAVTPNFIYDHGSYRISVRVKKAGTNGIHSDIYGAYDNYKAEYINSGIPSITSITLTDDDLVQGEKLGFKLTADTPELVQYKILILEPNSAAWKIIQDWTSPYSGNTVTQISPGYIYMKGNYRVSVWMKKAYTNGITSNSYGRFDTYKAMNFSCRLEQVNQNYNYSMDTMVSIQYNLRPLVYSGGKFVYATRDQISYYVNTNNFLNDYGKYQFLRLDYMDGISVDELDKVLYGKGVLSGKGAVFLKAAQDYNVNPAYLVGHALHETGNGTSALARGINVTSVDGTAVAPKIVYNMFGIGAYDANPNKYGSEYAYTHGWDTVDKAIAGGAEWISKYYINSSTNKQNTLYKMRWNPNVPGTHQYATDIGWAYNQITYLKSIVDNCRSPKILFEIPVYK